MRRSSSTIRILVFNSAINQLLHWGLVVNRTMPGMKAITLLLALALSAPVLAQQGKGRQGGQRGQPQHMSQEDRQRMRDDMRDAYRDRDRARQDRQRPMTREERDKLRQDVEDANRSLRR